MASIVTTSTSDTRNVEEKLGPIDEIRDENVLREMWEDAEDPDEKRQLRSRMYKMREDRIKEYYGREGHEILDNIFKPDFEPEPVEDDLMKTTVQGSREVTVSSAESKSTDGTQTMKSSGIQVKQCVTSVSKSGSRIVSNEEEGVKKRMNKKDRTSQFKEIQTKRRKDSSGEIEIINMRKGKSPSATSTGNVTTNNNNNFNNKVVVAKNIRNEIENGVSETQKRSGRGEGVTKVVNGRSSITSSKACCTSSTTTSTTAPPGTKSTSKAITETNKMSTDNQSAATSTTTSITRKHRREDSSTMTMTKSLTTTTSASFSTNRIVSSSSSSSRKEAFNNLITSTGNVKSSTGTVVVISSEQVPLGSVQIEEVLERSLEGTAKQGSSTRGTSATRQTKDVGNKTRQAKADADVINRNLASSTVGSALVTKSESTKTTSSGRVCSKSSSVAVNANSNTNTSNGSGMKEKNITKALDKSGETKESKISKGQGRRGSKGAPKTTETSQTPTVKVDRAETLAKGDNKTEESIIRELDILDTYLSQRSVSIEESGPSPSPTGAKEQPIRMTKVNGTMAVDQPRKVGDDEIDVMESGLEPPFTSAVYKYGCPGEDHRHHPDHDDDTPADKKNTNESRLGKRGEKSERHTRTDDTTKSNIEDEIIVDEIRFGKSEGKLSTDKSVKLLRQKEINPTTNSPTNLSSKGANRAKAHIKKTPEVSEQPQVLKATSAFTTTSKGAMDTPAKQKKYDADILSRPSVFRRKSVERPNPNPRVRKGSDSSPERDVNARKGDKPQVRRPVRVKSDDNLELDEGDDDNDEDDDNPLIPEKRRDGGKLDSPGAVLKAKSLFETKAQEAAMDRASSDFDMDKGLTKTAKVSKKAALFEARSRGERVSISSESSVSVNLEGPSQMGDKIEPHGVLGSQIRSSVTPEYQPARHKDIVVNKSDGIANARAVERGLEIKKSEVTMNNKKSEAFEDKASSKLFDSSKKSDSITRKSENVSNTKKSETALNSRKSEVGFESRKSDIRMENSELGTTKSRKSAKGVEDSEQSTRTEKISQNMGNSESSSKAMKSDHNIENSEPSPRTKKVAPNRENSERNVRTRKSDPKLEISEPSSKSSKSDHNIENSELSARTRKSDTIIENSELSTRNRKSDQKIEKSESTRNKKSEPKIENSEPSTRIRKSEPKMENSEPITRTRKSDTIIENSEPSTRNRKSDPKIEKSEPTTRNRKSDPKIENSQPSSRSRKSEKNIENSEQILKTEKSVTPIENSDSRKLNKNEEILADETLENSEPSIKTDISETTKADKSRCAVKVQSNRSNRSEVLDSKTSSESRLSRRSSQEKSKPEWSKENRPSWNQSRENSDLKQIFERRRSSVRANSLVESKVEAILNKTKTSTITRSQSVASSNRMTTTELNAIDSMDDIQDLERLLEKATDYDERSKIRGRIRALKRKVALVKRPSTEGEESPDRSVKRSVSIRTSDEPQVKPKLENTKAYERRRSSSEIPPNKVTTRKKSNDLPENLTSARKTTSEQRIRTEVNAESEVTASRRSSREKKVSTDENLETPRKFSRQKSSESPSRTRNISQVKEKSEEKVSGERKLSSETQELLSTRKYSREKAKDVEDEVNSSENSRPTSRRNSKEVLTSRPSSPTKGSPGPESRSTSVSRRESREKTSPTRTLDSVPEAKASAEVKRNMTKAEKYEADILSRPSVFHQKRQNDEAEDRVLEPQVQKRTSRDSVSPQRSEIPISNRMKSARESSPPKMITEEPQKSEARVGVSQETSKTELIKSEVLAKDESEVLATDESKVTSVQKSSTRKSSSRKNSEELRASKSNKPTQPEETRAPVGSRKNSEDQIVSGSKFQRRQSTEEGQSQTVSSSAGKNAYTRKTSSKEIKSVGVVISDSAEGQSGSSRVPAKEIVETTKGHPTPDDDKSTTTINFNQEQEPTNPPTHPSSPTTQQQKKTTKESTRGQQGMKQTTTFSSSTTRRAATTTNKASTISTSNSNNADKTEGTESITSSYGVGPTDDDGTPLFGLRALRKIKQVQEEFLNRESDQTPPLDGSTESRSSTLRSSENFGLRALKKGSVVSRGYDSSDSVSGAPKSRESSVPVGLRGENKSESVLSSSQISSSSSRTSSRGDGTLVDQGRGGIGSSPKSILKKTSSFTSQSSGSGGGIVKSKTETESNNNLDEIGRDDSERSTWPDSAVSSNNLDDSSWRRKSMSPSPIPDGQSMTGGGTFSRGKVGRSSVKEMSKRFETSETSSSALTSSTSNISSTTTSSPQNDHTIKASFVRADSPSRIPSPIRSTTTTTVTKKSTTGVRGSGPESTTVVTTERGTGSDFGEISDSDNPGGYRVTQTTVTKRSGVRSFLTDQSPIHDLSDVIERMKGEEGRYAQQFTDEDQSCPSDGLNLLNKFIGAQIIMKAVEPMLGTHKVSMTSSSTSSLVINGVDVDAETDPAKLTQLLSEVEGADGEKIQHRLDALGTGSLEEMKVPQGEAVVEPMIPDSPSAADVTGELMPLILGQLQSSLDNLGASSSSGSGIHTDSILSSHNNNNNDNSSTTSSHNNTNGSPKRGGVVCEGTEEGVGSAEECLFDSGTESGEDVVSSPGLGNRLSPQTVHHAKSVSSPAEFSHFMEGLRNTLKRNKTKDSLLKSQSLTEPFLRALDGETSDSGAFAVASLISAVGGGGIFCDGNISGSTRGEVNDSVVKDESSPSTSEDPDLIQQVDKVLTLLRDSLVKDPNCLKLSGIGELDLNPDPTKGKELIALIDRLKSSLTTTSDQTFPSGEDKRRESLKENKDSPLPTVIGTSEETDRRSEMFTWAQTRPPDIVPLPWVSHIQSSMDGKSGSRKNSAGRDDLPWKVRGGKRRTHGRSHTVGVTLEELAEARRYLQESAYRNAVEEEQKQFDQEVSIDFADAIPHVEVPPLPSEDEDLSAPLTYREENKVVLPYDEESRETTEFVKPTMERASWQKDVEKGLTSIPRPFVKSGFSDSGYRPPPERRMTYASIDDSISGLENSSSTFAKVKPFRTFSLDNPYDPSQSLFTKEETVHIAIHQAAIKKQMSEEEDRRKRRNSFSSNTSVAPYGFGTQPVRDFSLALPKPYSLPQKDSTGKLQGHSGVSMNGTGSGTGSRSYPTPTPSGDSGYTEESGSDSRQARNDQLVLYQTSQISPNSNSTATFVQQPQSPSNQRIENVQISLKELNSSEFPQLQIAITLNTNNSSNNNNHHNNNSSSSNLGNNGGNIADSGQGNTQSQFHVNTNINKGANQGTNFISDGGIAAQNIPNASNKAMRYKSKNERKKRLKRANTIDIPQPPGFLLSNDDDSEMEDEEDSDGNNSNSNIAVKTVQFTYAPFKPRTDGDRKFLAFLEKNSSMGDSNKPIRPSYLGVNDNFWNNRFFNLKSSFESSSQGSSPSASPILSPNRPPRSVSEMALTHGVTPTDTYSKPVWATTDPGQLPQQVKSKLHVFESKSSESGPKDAPWRSAVPQNQNPYSARGSGQAHQGQHNHRSGNQFTSKSTVYSTNVVRPPMLHDKKPSFEGQNVDGHLVKRPVAVKPSGNKVSTSHSQQSQQLAPRNAPQVPTQAVEGVHMVHATASALEAMKRSGFGPTAVVQPQRSSQVGQNVPSSQPPPIPPKKNVQEKIELPWAKKEPTNPQEGKARDVNAGRILLSKAKFEQMSQPELVPMAPAVAHSPVVAPPPIPPKSIKLIAGGGSNVVFNNQSRTSGMRQSIPATSVPNVANLGRGYEQTSNALYAPGGAIKAKLGSFEVTQSFDEDYKRRVESQPTMGRLQLMRSEPYVKEEPNKGSFHQVSQDPSSSITGTRSAFARKVSASEPSSRRSSGQEEEEAVVGRKPSIDGVTPDGVIIQTPVVAKVMRGPQQQRVVLTGSRMSSVNDDPQTSRLTNARSNIRNILNQYQQKSPSHDDSSDTSPPILKANLQLSLPPLTKSMSGDALLQSHFRPTSLIVGPEELRFQSSSPNLKQYSSMSATTMSPASMPVSPHQISPIRKEPESMGQKPHNTVIPKQRSLAEFPKFASAPNIGVLTIQTDLETLGKGMSSKVDPQTYTKPLQQVPVQSKPIQQQSRSGTVQRPATQPQQPPQQKPQDQSTRAPKVPKSYPATDSLQRTSSGSSIFNRAQSLFLSSQEGMPPVSKSRPKPPTLPKTHGMFPKQFEAQMSPDSANKKQREVEAYFAIQQQIQQQQQQQSSQHQQQGKGKVTLLRKSASHSKIMSRQRSLSDGEEDVDQIFESLFKASAVEKSVKSAELSEPPSPSKSVEMTSESNRMSSATSFNQSISVQSSSSSSITSSTSHTLVGGGGGLNKFKQMDQQAKANSGGAPLFKFANPGLKASANSAKDILLYWTQCRTRDYENVKIENFSSSWSDGLAFCALIHHFFPDAFDYNSLDPKNRRYNFDLAFRIADEKAGIFPLLDTEDMLVMGRRPDWKCVFTYVQAMYQKLKEFS